MNRKTTKDGITILDAEVVHKNMRDEFTVEGWIFVGLLALGVLAAVYRVMRLWVLPAKSVKAVVVDKYKYDTLAPRSPTGKNTTYAVIFLVSGKRKRFYVSPLGYDGYRIGESGTLKYKGTRLLGFE